MASRTRITSADTPPVSGSTFVDNIADHIATMYQNIVLRLTSVAGTNDITASIDPPLDASSYQAGQSYILVPVNNTTGAVTLDIDNESAVDVVDADGNALTSGALQAGTAYLLHYDGFDFRVLTATGSGASAAAGPDRQVFTSSGTWTKPVGLNDETPVLVQAWGGGGAGGGDDEGGGGGGAYVEVWLRAGDLAATESVTVGAGGVSQGGNGGNSTFGSHVTALGGFGTSSRTGGNGGGPSNFRAQGGTESTTQSVANGEHATNLWGGGAGGAGGNDLNEDGGNGGDAIWGGAGGAGESGPGSNGSAGSSTYGGAGGAANGGSGVAPGGGGGNQGNGARGEVRVLIP